MRKRRSAGKVAGELNLPVLVDKLELALVAIPDRTSVCRALSDLDQRLGSRGGKAFARAVRSTPMRPQPQTVAESLPLFP